MKTEVLKYDGSSCTSACGNDYDCPHEERFDEEREIRRSGLDFTIKCLCHEKRNGKLNPMKLPNQKEMNIAETIKRVEEYAKKNYIENPVVKEKPFFNVYKSSVEFILKRIKLNTRDIKFK